MRIVFVRHGDPDYKKGTSKQKPPQSALKPNRSPVYSRLLAGVR